MNLSTKQYFQEAEAGEYALGQFNVSTADQMKAVMEVGRKFDLLPVMIGTSEGEWKFLGLRLANQTKKSSVATPAIPPAGIDFSLSS